MIPWEIQLAIALLPYAIELTEDVIAAIQRLIAAGHKQQPGLPADLVLATQAFAAIAQNQVGKAANISA